MNKLMMVGLMATACWTEDAAERASQQNRSTS